MDCTPKGIASKNKEGYQATGIKAIWQGCEKHELAGYSFVAQVNYAGALNRQFASVVSCNTTALSWVLHALHRHDWVKRARAVLLRRGTGPWESHKNGMINTIDCIRAFTGIETDGARSIEKTNATMGVTKTFLPGTTQPIQHLAGAEVEHPEIEAVRATRVEFRSIGFKGHEGPVEPTPTDAQHGSYRSP